MAAGFTLGSNASGDQHHTLQYFSVLAAQHSMVWMGLDLASVNRSALNPSGNQQGLVPQATNNQVGNDYLLCANYFGKQLAQA